MSFIQTKSFKLAVYEKGSRDSSKLALLLPGKLDTKDYSHMCSHVDFLAGKGYLALSFDPPGTWESSGDIKLYTMTNYLIAINELVEYFGNKQTLVMGHSRGGSMAIVAGATNPYITHFVSVMSSFIKGGFREKADDTWKKERFVVSMRDFPPGGGPKEKRFELPFSFYEDQIKYDLTDEITGSTKPKLFFLGKQDELIAPESIKKTYELFVQPKELYKLDSSHDYRLYPNIINKVNEIVGNFLDTYKG